MGAIGVVALAATACAPPEDGSAVTTTAASADELVRAADGAVQATSGDGRTVLSRFSGARWFLGDVPAPAAAGAVSGEPVVVGMIDTDGPGPVAMPELRVAAEAAVAFVNGELGGVRGRPIRMSRCGLPDPVPEGAAAACANRLVAEGAVAVIGGVGRGNDAALSALESAGVAWIGGLPVTDAEFRSPVSFRFSGGLPAMFAAFMADARTRVKADSVGLLVTDEPTVRATATSAGENVARRLGIDSVRTTTMPPTSEGLQAGLDAALSDDPDALVLAIPESLCGEALKELVRRRGAKPAYLPSTCGSPELVDAAGSAGGRGRLFNSDRRMDQRADGRADTEIAAFALEAYGSGARPTPAGTTSFAAVMNLWRALSVTPGDPAPGPLLAHLRSVRGEPGFDGPDLDCGRPPVPALPALCSPQQVVYRIDERDVINEVSPGWIDLGPLLTP